MTTELFPYQKEAVERLLQSRHKGSMLVSEQRPLSRKLHTDFSPLGLEFGAGATVWYGFIPPSAMHVRL